MARVFSIPLFLILFLIGMKFLCTVPHAHAAAPTDGNSVLWKSIQDYEDKYAFDLYGPPLPQNRARFESEQQLYEDMVQHFDEVGEDEYDFTFIILAYDVPVDVFRPEIIRPGEAVKESEDNPFGEDDPLPESVSSTSAYVEEIRPTFLPGGPLKQRSMQDVKLAPDQQGSLFSEKKPALEVLPAPEAAAAGQSPLPTAKTGATDVPKKQPQFDTDADTLANLKAAVKQLGLERKLNLDPKSQRMGSGDDAPVPPTPAPTSSVPAIPTTQSPTPVPTTAPAPVAPAAPTPAPAPVTQAPVAAPKAVAPQAKAKKKAVKKKKRRAVKKQSGDYSDDGVITPQAAPAEDTAVPPPEGGYGEDD
jgi:hypothetical protein